MNNQTEFKHGDYVKCKTWAGDEFLGVFEYHYPNGSYCVVDAITRIHYNVRPKDIEYAVGNEAELIRVLVQKNDIVPKQPPEYLQMITRNKQKKESDLELILKPIEEIS